jgi:hypothetical protein
MHFSFRIPGRNLPVSQGHCGGQGISGALAPRLAYANGSLCIRNRIRRELNEYSPPRLCRQPLTERNKKPGSATSPKRSTAQSVQIRITKVSAQNTVCAGKVNLLYFAFYTSIMTKAGNLAAGGVARPGLLTIKNCNIITYDCVWDARYLGPWDSVRRSFAPRTLPFQALRIVVRRLCAPTVRPSSSFGLMQNI